MKYKHNGLTYGGVYCRHEQYDTDAQVKVPVQDLLEEQCSCVYFGLKYIHVFISDI